MTQRAKIFVMNTTRSGGEKIDDQINHYIEEHSECYIKSVSYIMAGVFEKALVIFEIEEPLQSISDLQDSRGELNVLNEDVRELQVEELKPQEGTEERPRFQKHKHMNNTERTNS